MQDTSTKAQRRSELLRGFDDLSDDALTSVDTLAALRGRSRSATWEDLRVDPTAPKTIKLTPRCTRVRVGDVRRWVRGEEAVPA